MAKEIQFQDSTGEKYYPLPSWPIGSIYISVINTNPKAYFGGTWVSFGTGRCLVGVDTSQKEFNTVEKPGGSKYLQKHKHSCNTIYPFTPGSMYTGVPNSTATSYHSTETGTVNYEGTGNSGNLQPYITVYMWKRTA